MPLVTAALNDGVNGIAAGITHLSLHTASPSTNGANEVSGGSYARKAITWGAASGGIRSGSVTFDVPAGTTITHAGGWTALTAGTFKGGAELSGEETFGSAGTYQLTASLTVTAV